MVLLKLSIRCSTGPKFDVNAEATSTVRELKSKIEGQANMPPSQQKLIYRGRIMNDDSTLEHYGIADGDAVHLVQGVAPQESAASRDATVGAAGSGFGGGMGGMGGMPGMQGMESMLQQNPELMASMMDSPMMRSLMDNPEIMRQIMMSNPQMRSLMEQNPQLTHVLNDPELLRQMMSAARNPNVMQEMMRNQDRAMANIESLPGGYNALRRMYHDVQEPMMEATESGMANGGNTGSSNTDTNLETGGPDPVSTPMPNPWGSSGGNTPSRQPSAPRQPFFPPGFGGMGTNSDSGQQQGGNNPFMLPMPPPEVLNSLLRAQGVNSSSMPASRTTNSSSSRGVSLDGPNPWAAPTSADSPEQKYKSQLEQLENMGFPDKKANIQALLRNNGEVNAAVESLIEEMSK
uniref:Ubiquilin n=1 Tax=Mucochytrium quahogii TaxID=96639 RepID=A0A7S2S5R3_9STRA|mmetsp:Transcript_14421/g.23469  ORF Transcript_14421/g.23469 Transcript_14421/m.23469 type:complete len:404 (+) Transcript_14421:208-1419(+)|eukprot:CAMPEP_0203758870 /NCGR_PEP_ID=MMETSP0098-20131031/11741_1 /ASSEMBLY_ACC=CAM_ASM_000208 /TAXON_ID=96639 /ORGANISM=" , Strain NY0313808BC1" /LENGTH=403 /DNA_ID=CAMNT_0050651513 /DNA_START=253 /DNA_END=1464 /DNA_ORIENTATION=-